MAFNSAPLALLSDHQMNPNNSNIEYLNLTNTDQNNLTNPHQNLHNPYYQPPQDTDMNHQSYNLSQEHRQLQPWDGNGYPEHYDMNNSGYDPNQANQYPQDIQTYNNHCPEPFGQSQSYDIGRTQPLSQNHQTAINQGPPDIRGASHALGLAHPNTSVQNQLPEDRLLPFDSALDNTPNQLLPPPQSDPDLRGSMTMNQLLPPPQSDPNLRGSMTMNTDETLISRNKKARDLNAATKQRLENIGLTRLRKEANENVTHHRMTDNIREELDELYYQFQCSINRLLANTGVGAHLLYNNYCEYDPVAQRLFDENKPDEVTRLWHSKSKAEQDRYRDMDYIESIVDNSIKESKAESKGIVQSSVAGQKYMRSVLADWVRKISIDLKSLSFFHQIEGFFVLASRHPKSNFFCKRGTPLGFEYLQLLIGEDDPFSEFHIWVGGRGVEDSKANKAKEAQKKTSVAYKDEVVPVHEWDEGNHKPNLKSIRRRLSALMYNASGGEIDKGWPATDTASMLQKYNLKVVIEPNDQGIKMTHFEQPLCKLNIDQTRDVLAVLGTNKVRMTYSRPPPTTVATKNNMPAPKKRKRHHRTDNTASEEAAVTGTAPADTTTATTGNSADSTSTLTESGQTSGAQTSHANVTPTGSSAGATGSPPPYFYYGSTG
ncbi:hypothetical protein KEM48_008419 [Puccinia striiformis f. sp. tritici PST-130]|nr:hypothetical protein KEM48_008419 [Puccinia striiformis f. sp. tritici PST-130]